MDACATLQRFAGKRVLLLQGPVGPFFARFARALQEVGATVFKVNFNGGDWAFYRRGCYRYRGKLEDWPRELRTLVDQLKIEAIVMFGDCRSIHSPAHELAQQGVQVWAFEEGYVRPNFVTFEPHGVNNRSQLSRDPNFHRETPPPSLPPIVEVGNTFWWAAIWAVMYYIAAFVLRPVFRTDLHHRPLCLAESLPWIVSAFRKWKYKWLERKVERRLSGLLSKQYFIVPLQVTTDAQVVVHSSFESIPAFIDAVVASFARNAAPNDALIIKHHPMDRGYNDYSAILRELADRYALGERLLYVHDQHLPTLLANARGVVVINSTVGLSALHHGTPLKVMGEALYAMPGLTAQCDLDRFWTEPERWMPDPALYAAFVANLIATTQLNGSFYRRGLFLAIPPQEVDQTAARGLGLPDIQRIGEEFAAEHSRRMDAEPVIPVPEAVQA